MKSARLVAIALALTLIAALSGYAALRAPQARPAAAVAAVAPPVAPREVLAPRASRSRPSATPSPARILTPKPARTRLTSRTPAVRHTQPKITTRRTVRGSHYSRVSDITMYCSGTTTASGKRVREGMVATLDRSIPFGTVVQIEGMGSYVVEDRIGHGSEFDIYTTSCGKANEFGRHHLLVSF